MTAKFWVGGTATWDGVTTTNWSLTTGGAGGAAVPGSGDTVTFDANSGGGTVTVNTTVNVTSITMGVFTGGTLDFSVNNNNVTLQTFSGTGTVTRGLKMGSGTWTITTTGPGNAWDFTTVTALTFSAGTSTLLFSVNGTGAASNNNRTVVLGTSLTYNIVSIAGEANGWSLSFATNTGVTIGTLNLSAPIVVALIPMTITNSSWLGGSISSMVTIDGGNSGNIILSNAPTAASFCAFRRCAFTGAGAGFTATNSVALSANNTGVTITGPGGRGGSFMIGG